jgi:two-component system, cell cycle sensor histidine kinase and response regulator CckA
MDPKTLDADGMRRSDIQNTRLWLVLGVLLLNLFVIGILALSLARDYKLQHQEASTTTLNLAGTLEQSVDEMLQKIDLILVTITDELQTQLSDGGISKERTDGVLERHLSRLPGIYNLLATDRSGVITYGTERNDDAAKVSDGISIAERDYFIRVRNEPDAGLVISKPYKGKLSNQWTIAVARRYNHQDGSFAGMVFAPIRVDYFVSMFSKVNLGKKGVVSLLDGEPSIIARYPEPSGTGSAVGFKLTIPSVLNLIRSGKEEATFTVVSGVDKVERTFSYRKVPGHSLFILVGLGTEDYMEAWRKEAVLNVALGACFVFFTCLLAWLVHRGLKQREHDLRALGESEERYRSLFDGVPTAIFRSTPSGRILNANPAYVHLLGYPGREALMAVNASNLYVHPEEREQWQSVLEREGLVRGFEVRLRRYDGTTIWVRISSRAVRDNKGQVQYCEGTIEDITERKRAEAERSKLEEQLRQSQKMETVGLLAGGVAHDFNNLLTPILGYTEMLICGFPQDDSRRVQLEQVNRAAERAKELTHELLAFSRKQILELKTVDLGDIIRRFESMLRRTIRENISIQVGISPSLSLVRADKGQIEQVLVNLSINAQDAMPEGGTLMIEAMDVDLDESYTSKNPEIVPGPYVMLAVSDTGTGMDEQTMQHVFEPFFTTKESGKGTGLGLSTVYGIVSQHGGSITVYSEKNRGSTFKVFLSRVTEEGARAEEYLPLPDEVVRGVETVLVVEDNEMVRTLACDTLESLGYRVLAAESPIICIELVKGYEGPISLLLTDVVMPGMNGRELFNILGRTRPELRVLFMSGYSSNVIGHHGVLDEGVNFIQKPFSVHALSKKIRKVLDS